ncbi:hypothetical protein [Clostridium estertheticum]|uniref:hypothetical protein n=1 Tax=Clostridium estertheticum TaxID=238834 RepID=UPI00311A986D
MIGGSIGIGTVIMACLIGFFVQLIFKIFKFDIEKIQHKFVGKDINFIHQQE